MMKLKIKKKSSDKNVNKKKFEESKKEKLTINHGANN